MHGGGRSIHAFTTLDYPVVAKKSVHSRECKGSALNGDDIERLSSSDFPGAKAKVQSFELNSRVAIGIRFTSQMNWKDKI